MHLRQKLGFVACQRGTTAVEFALVAPVLFALIIGTLSTGTVVYSAAGLRDSVEQAARCYSVNADLCSSAATTQTYAQNAYYGMDKPTFTASIQSCGHQVAGTVTIELTTFIVNFNVPLSAQACFP
jgi:Flp pilus assembly protein TadG